jgi:hypothetical protein
VGGPAAGDGEWSGVAQIFETTVQPSKLALVSGWLPQQPWWTGGDRVPELTPAGGFRLDDPDGEVGIEFHFFTDVAAGPQVTYHVPLTYRGAPLDGAEAALVGTTEHGVLGRRWVYDAAQDPVATAALAAFVHGRVQAQHQNQSFTPEPSVTCSGAIGADAVVELVRVLDGAPAATSGYVEAGWSLPDGTAVRGPVALVR